MIISNVDITGLCSIAKMVQAETGISNPFLTPEWILSWWEVFGGDYSSYIKVGIQDTKPVAIAPLKISGDTATFLGSTDICDYQDFIAINGKEEEFFTLLLDDVKKEKIRRLHLRHLRPDSLAITELAPVASALKHRATVKQETVSLEMPLPSTFSAYLDTLDKKNRHEIRRKMRRLLEANRVKFYYTGDNYSRYSYSPEYMQDFLRLFFLNQIEKAGFMTPLMQQFFNKIWEQAGPSGVLRFGCLEVDGERVAMVLLFDCNNSIFLYNNAYNFSHANLSVGLLSKVLAIEKAINIGRCKWDFLKGDEKYKRWLGGTSINLYSLEIELS